MQTLPPCKREMGHVEDHSQLQLHSWPWECCASMECQEHPMPWGESESEAADPDAEPCCFLLPNHCWKSRRARGAACLAEAQQDLLQIQPPQRGLGVTLYPRQDRHCCCFWDAPTSHSCVPRENRIFHVCSQHTGSGSCSLQLLLFQQNHRFYGANFIEDQMNPVFSSTSNRSAHSSHPFLPKNGKEQKTNHLKQGRGSKKQKTPRK